MEECPHSQKQYPGHIKNYHKFNPVLQQKVPVLIDEVCNGEPRYDRQEIGQEADASEKAVAKVNRDPEEGDHRPDDYGHQGKEFGGADRDRTDDLLNAIQALSQLSYNPHPSKKKKKKKKKNI